MGMTLEPVVNLLLGDVPNLERKKSRCVEHSPEK